MKFRIVIISPTPNINDGNTSIASSAAAAVAAANAPPSSASQNEENEKLFVSNATRVVFSSI